MAILNIFGLLLFIISSCAPLSTTSPESSSSESPMRQQIGPIPVSLENKSYKDSSGTTVIYDHKSELERLLDLKSQGKELYLIIGRGNGETHQQALDVTDNKRVWVYGQINEKLMVKDQRPHLLMNFDDEEHLKTIPDEVFSAITFDWSVVKFFSNMADSVRHFHRILKPSGIFYADFFSGSTGIGIEQKHIDGFQQGKALYTTTRGIDYFLGPWDAGICCDGRKKFPNEDDYAEMATKRQENIAQHLSTVFGSTQRCVLKTSGYPVFENKDINYYECTK